MHSMSHCKGGSDISICKDYTGSMDDAFFYMKTSQFYNFLFLFVRFFVLFLDHFSPFEGFQKYKHAEFVLRVCGHLLNVITDKQKVLLNKKCSFSSEKWELNVIDTFGTTICNSCASEGMLHIQIKNIRYVGLFL